MAGPHAGAHSSARYSSLPHWLADVLECHGAGSWPSTAIQPAVSAPQRHHRVPLRSWHPSRRCAVCVPQRAPQPRASAPHYSRFLVLSIFKAEEGQATRWKLQSVPYSFTASGRGRGLMFSHAQHCATGRVAPTVLDLRCTTRPRKRTSQRGLIALTQSPAVRRGRQRQWSRTTA